MTFRFIAKMFVKKLLNPDPVARPSAAEALDDPVSIPITSPCIS